MDIYLHLSRYEGLPNAVLEAGASALPIVTTNATGCANAIRDGITGYVVPIGDIEVLTTRLKLLCDTPQLRYSMGRAGRQFVSSQFSNQIVWCNLLKYLDSLAA